MVILANLEVARNDAKIKMIGAKSNKRPCLQAGDIIDLGVQGDSAQSSSPAPGLKEILTDTSLIAPVRVTASPIASEVSAAPLVTQPPNTDSTVATTVSVLLVTPDPAHASAVISPSTVATVTPPLVASTLATVTRSNVTASEFVSPLVSAVSTVTIPIVPPVPLPAPTLTPDATASTALVGGHLGNENSGSPACPGGLRAHASTSTTLRS